MRVGLLSLVLLCIPILSGCGQIACADSGACARPIEPRCARIGPPYYEATPEGALNLTQADSGRTYPVVVGQVVFVRLPASVAKASDICAVPYGGESPLTPVSVRQMQGASLTEVAFRADGTGEIRIMARGADGYDSGVFSVRIRSSRPAPVCAAGSGSMDAKQAATHLKSGDYQYVRVAVGRVVLVSLPRGSAPIEQICYQPNRYRDAVLEPVSITGSADPSMTTAAFVAARPGHGDIVNLNAPPPGPANCLTCSILFTVTVTG